MSSPRKRGSSVVYLELPAKILNELYAGVFGRCYGMATIGLRYFNVFGARQDPEGPYAAVIPRWARAMLTGEPCVINGDGETSRDFCYVANTVQANLRAALTDNPKALNQLYNVAVGGRTTLAELHRLLGEALIATGAVAEVALPVHRGFRAGDVRHSQAGTGKARHLLGYAPTHDVRAGLAEAVNWYTVPYSCPRGGLRRSISRGYGDTVDGKSSPPPSDADRCIRGYLGWR